MYKKALITTDGSESSKNEITKILNVIDQNDGELIILSVADKVVSHHFQRQKHVDRLNEDLLKEAEYNVNDMKKNIPIDTIPIKTRVGQGHPADVIVEVSQEEDVDLIIIARSGRSNINKFFLGSVAEKVVKNSSIDVLLIN